ncbi:MAG TPA: hypothetical protein VM639_24680 [Dongiaceae bacterium]|nr:hypothetical protein [Dongiaceae bacterium]
MTTTTPLPASGSKLYIGGIGALDSETGWTLIGNVITMGEYGAKDDTIDYVDLGSGIHIKLKGPTNAGAMAATLAKIPSDAGQAALKAAYEDKVNDYNFKVEWPDRPSHSGGTPSTEKFKGKVMGYTTNIQNANSVIQAGVAIELNSVPEFIPAA